MSENEQMANTPAEDEDKIPEEDILEDTGGESPPEPPEPVEDGAGDSPEAEAAGPEAEGVGPEPRIAELEAQVADLNDRLLRAMAETENVRRIAQRDKENASKYAIKSFAEQMITVSDNLGRALQSVDATARADNPALENIAVGIEMVDRELVNGFEKFGIKPIEALGQKFDPMLHEAMFEIEDVDTAAGTVARVLEVGYTLNGRTLRAAKVGITKGGPKIAPASASGDADESEASRDGQGAYESKGAEPGSNLDREL